MKSDLFEKYVQKKVSWPSLALAISILQDTYEVRKELKESPKVSQKTLDTRITR